MFGMCFFSAVYCWSSVWLCTDLLAASRDAGKDSLNGKLGMNFRCVCATNQVSVFHVSHGSRCKEDLKTLRGGELLSAQITWNVFPLVSARRVMDSQLFISRDKLFRKKSLVKAFDRHWDLAGSVIAEFKMKSHSSATNISVLAAI